MSYCVHCGVKLSQGEAKCPLCQTPVLDPSSPVDLHAEREWPAREHAPEAPIDRRATAGLMAILLCVPSLICVLVNLLAEHALTWSLYVSGGAAVVLLTLVTALMVRRGRVAWTITAADAALCLYLWMVERVSGSGTWFETVVFPVLLLAGIMALASWQSIRQGIVKGLAIWAAVLLECCVAVLAVDLLTTGLTYGALRITWSAFVMIPCGIIAAMLLTIHNVRPLRRELKRKLHL